MARSVGFEGIGAGALVYFESALVRGTDENKLVKISANKTVALATEDDNFIGIVRVIDAYDKAAGVQLHGFVEDYPYDTDHVPTVTDTGGWQALQCGSAATKVKPATEGVTIPLRRVVSVDGTAHTITFEL
jgi:hypothetical protein